jgi:hypothetical protein
MLYDGGDGFVVATVVVVVVAVAVIPVVWGGVVLVATVELLFCRSPCDGRGDEENIFFKKLRNADNGPLFLFPVAPGATWSAVTGSGPWAVWPDVSVT